MTNLSYLSDHVLNVIRETPEYREYAGTLAKLQENPELYAKVNEMREKNFNLQNRDDEDIMDLMDALTNEYEDVIGISEVKDFINAEAAFCRLMQDFVNAVTEGLEFD